MNIISIAGQLILSLSILVVLHEFGHYLPAKWFKTRVEKFYLFFNPYFSLFKKKIGETEWGIGWIPFGGYVKISGMIDESMDKDQMDQPVQSWEFRAKPAWQRLIIMCGGVIVNFILGFFIYAMILFFYGNSYYKTSDAQYGIAVDSLGMQLGLQDGDQVLKVGDYELERFSSGKVSSELIFNEASSLNILRNGNNMSLNVPENFGAVLTAPENKGKSLFYPRYPLEIAEVKEESLAAKAGLQKTDKIKAINGVPINYSHEYAKEILKHRSELIGLSVLRGGESIDVNVQLDSTAVLGIYQEAADKFIPVSKEKFGFFESLPLGVNKGMAFLKNQIKAFGMMFSGKLSAKDNLGSVFSIATLFDSSWDWERFWTITASLSIILGFFNILPIPALDGGYVMFLLWELISGKKPSDKFMEVVNIAGFIVLITLMVFALGLDINRLFGG